MGAGRGSALKNRLLKALPYAVTALLFGIFAILYTQLNNNTAVVTVRQKEKTEIVVQIVGEVAQEGILLLEEGARVIDAITEAGGVSQYADLDDINLVRVLNDGEKLEIPAKLTPPPPPAEGEVSEETSPQQGGLININTASSAELQTLPGIGPVTAGRIIAYRQNKSFVKNSDIMKVKGIGKATYNDISALITTGNE